MSTVRAQPTRRAALLNLVVSAARLDRTQSDPVVAARNALGVAAPLVVGALVGNAAYGLPSAIGALQTAFADRPGPYRLRMMRMLGTALAAAVTSGLAVLCSRSDAASVLLLFVLGVGAGLLLTGGPSATQVGVASTAAALVLGHYPQPASVAPHLALLVLIGGAGQVVLAVAAWPLGRHRPERQALAGLYAELAAVGRRPPTTSSGPPGGDRLSAVRVTLYGLGHDHGPSVEAYRVLLDEAERIRRELVVLAGYAERLADAGRPGSAAAVRASSAAAAVVLGEVAAALEAGRPLDADVLAPARAGIEGHVAELEAEAGALTGPLGLTVRAAAGRARSLAGQLRAAVETARTGASEGNRGEEPDVYGVRRLRDPLAILRANLAPDSAVLRHAARLAILVSGSDLVVRLAGIDRGYWVPLTVLVVLRPDFASTFERSSMRVLGTVLGLVLATVLVHWVPGGQWYQVALIAVFFFGMRLAGPGNLGLGALCLAAMVVVLLELDGVAAHATVQLRAADTVVGGALALAAMLLTPLWERELVADRLGDLLAAYRDYLALVADPAADAARLQRARMRARLMRTNARASVDRARSEPVRGRGQVELGETVLVHSHRFIHAMLTVDAVRPAVNSADRPSEYDAFLAAVDATLAACEQAVRTGGPPPATAQLRPLAEQLAARLRAQPPPIPDAAVAGALIDATDRVTNSLDTLLAELGRQRLVRT